MTPSRARRRLWAALAPLVGLTALAPWGRSPTCRAEEAGRRPAPRAAEKKPSAEAVAFFESKVRPVLAENCVNCHGAKKQRGGLRLDSRAAALAGGDRGPALAPGRPDQSLLLKAVRHEDDLKMPPKSKLPREQVAALTRWVQMGAPWPGAETAAPAAPVRSGFQISDKDRAHWAFQPVRRSALPTVKDSAWARNPVDAFILARLEAKGLRPNPPAGRRELIRRACYDLTGLPPTPPEVEAFVADPRPDAYERLVDRLLESPHYGEKWGRHWLDLVRFAETNSYERDNPKPHAWRYRDYVIRAFNADKPYDRFVREQLAGDELPGHDGDALIATGYYRLGIWDDEPTDREQARFDGLDDVVATTGQVCLGLTFDCARCHDHKIDPVPQKDYYSLLAFFRNVNHYRNGGPTDEAPLPTSHEAERLFAERTRDLERRRGGTQAAMAALEGEFNRRIDQNSVGGADRQDPVVFRKLIDAEGPRVLGAERFREYRALRRKLATLQREKVPGELCLCVTEAGPRAPDTFVLLRGNPHVPGERVEPAFPTIFGGQRPVIPTPPSGARSTGRRRVLADWITAPDNRLTARVVANRVWQYHFGRGIVRSPNNFGLQGDAPTHPELLDWLATELVRGGWRLKPLHRLLMTSSAYRLSSRGSAAGLKADPANDLFWRFDMRRLTAEEIRDSVLALSGGLSPRMYGPGVYPEMPREVLATQSMPGKGWGTSPPVEQNRRSVYVHVKRSLLTPILESFDVAETDRSAPVRFVTTQPTQALGMLNSDFMGQQADALAARLRREAGADVSRQVRLALTLATSRPAADAEVRRGVALIEALQAKDGVAPEAALKYFCLVVLNLNEFVYLD
jgi:hypothetical protein